MKTQLQFEGFSKTNNYFGGSMLIGTRKSARPLSRKHALHLILRSSRAKGPWSFLKHRANIQTLLNREAKKFGIRFYKVSYNGNHLHFLLRIHSRNEYKKFIRAISSLIAGKVTRTLGRRGIGTFWDARPFSRVVTFGRDFRYVANYVLQNALEAVGLTPYMPRKQRYSSA